MSIRLVLADDHPLILDGLENLFHLEKDFQVAARSAQMVSRRCRQCASIGRMS